ncbi:hypothetical protein ACMD2_12582 [Ananas comosus]|uniref:Uncharacterized protein n=1 Tax=Ananas comosus TaxID=4615 RepID=A0A199VTQ1_ANACO|nr:hypothetical protein ACMD2_12582 [Ananas comosus]
MLNSIRHRLLLLPPTNPSPPKSLSLCSSSVAPSSQTLTFLIDSCGLSPESALSASQKLLFKSAENPNAVLRLLRDYGFGEAHISKLISSYPAVLSSDPHSTLRPKLEALRSFGFSGESLARLLTNQPVLLRRSLEKHIIPCFTFLRTLLAAEGDFVSVFARNPHGLNSDLSKSILPILGVLRKHSLPEDRISKLVKIHPRILILRPLRVSEIVDQVKAAGVPTSSPLFIYAFATVAGQKRAHWDRKTAVFKGFGLSEADVVSSFRRHPLVMQTSEQKIRRGLEFLLHSLKLAPDDVVGNPILLCYSLEKRILPRCAVMSLLKREGKLEENSSVVQALLATTSSFLERFVMRYQDDVPEVLKAYNGEIKSNSKDDDWEVE